MGSALTTLTVTVCTLCIDGLGGECHVPGCMFWLTAAPYAGQAEAFRRVAAAQTTGRTDG